MVDIITLAMAKAAASGGSSGDMHITGNLQVDGNITQSGSSYETHAEKVYTKDDYIVTRDGAVSGLSSGDFSGFQVKKYDGTNDGRLVVDSDGTARVGDVGDEQPLLTRDEAADLVNGAPLVWDATNLKAVSGASSGGGSWVKRTANDDWSDMFSYDSATYKITVLKDIKAYYQGQIVWDLIKGFTFNTLNRFSKILSGNGTNYILFNKYGLMNSGDISGSTSVYHYDSDSYTFTTDGTNITITLTTVNNSMFKSGIDIYTKD